MTNQSFADTHTVIVGGGSGIGKTIASAIAALGGQVTLSSRTQSKLDRVASEIGPLASASAVDMTDEAAVKAWAGELGTVDHLVISASSAAHGRFADTPTADIRAMFEAKFFGPYVTARETAPFIRDGGSITLFSGVLSRRPGVGATGLGAVNSAVEGLVRGLALELGPRLRVNCMSPGMVRSDAYAAMPEDQRETMFSETADSLPLKRIGGTEDIADAVIMMMTNPYLTGVTLDVDGGHMVRQG